MKQPLLIGATLACASLVGTAQAASPYQPHASLALYGSYMNQKDDSAHLNPDGGGGGIQLGFSLTPNLFLSGRYQYNYLSESGAPPAGFGLSGYSLRYGERVQQGRFGGGLVFHSPIVPLDVFGKIEYVHYDYQTVNASVDGTRLDDGDRINDDGAGFHVGLQTRTPGVSVYGSLGYIDLHHSDGPEVNVGLMLPFAPFVWGFLEYQYDNFHANDYYDRLQSHDVRAGVRMSF